MIRSQSIDDITLARPWTNLPPKKACFKYEDSITNQSNSHSQKQTKRWDNKVARRCFSAFCANFCIKFRLKNASHSDDRETNILHLLTFLSRFEVKISSVSFFSPSSSTNITGQVIWSDKPGSLSTLSLYAND